MKGVKMKTGKRVVSGRSAESRIVSIRGRKDAELTVMSQTLYQ